jgi:hypothetical protein
VATTAAPKSQAAGGHADGETADAEHAYPSPSGAPDEQNGAKADSERAADIRTGVDAEKRETPATEQLSSGAETSARMLMAAYVALGDVALPFVPFAPVYSLAL